MLQVQAASCTSTAVCTFSISSPPSYLKQRILIKYTFLFEIWDTNGIKVWTLTFKYYVIAERISARLWIEDLISQSTYVHMYVVGHTQECHAECHCIPQAGPRYRPYVCHTVWHIQIRSTQIDRGQWHSLAMEMEVGDDGAVGPSRLGYYKHQTASFSYRKRNTCHERLTCTHIWHACIVCELAWGEDVHAYS